MSSHKRSRPTIARLLEKASKQWYEMTSLYEYKHPVINKQLASGPDEQSGRKFPTLSAWYNVVNDYEFQARCPIILKNSHRNKHFTFACHLKDCPFKVLLSYCGNQRGMGEESQHAAIPSHHDELNHSLAGLERKSKLEDGKEPQDDDDVSAAIAAAVAAVQDVRHKDGQFGDEYLGTSATTGTPRSSNDSVRGPFVVTKIEPYHNHPLESNLSLSNYVLTKVPRILQHDLNFDQILESLCNEDDNTVSKFRVSQYVEESGLLDILKERYGLTDAEIDKKLLSHISRRVTTYKARFVLKKKRNGNYGTPVNRDNGGSPSYARHTRNAAIGSDANGASRHLQALEDPHLNPELNDSEVQAAQAAAQAAIGEAVALKRSVQQMVDEDDTDEDGSRKRQMMKLSMGNNLVNDDGSLVALDDTPDDKLPRDVAEQLRLLSSHFKDVEAHNLNNHNGEPDEEGKLVVKDDIPDENIQPELRGQ